MIWRLWCFVAGLAPGALAVLAVAAEPSLVALELGAVAGGIVLAVSASLLARARDDDPARGAHLAAASSVGLAAAPACEAALLGLAPAPAWWLAAVAAALVAALAVAARVRGPAGPTRQLAAATLGLLGGAVLVVGVSAAVAALGADESGFSEARAAAVYEMDAQVVTRPLPVCGTAVASQRVLLDRGAHPRLDPDGAMLWFDASAPAPGREGGTLRQVHRLDRASGEVVCWTCDEPGNNARPALGAGGASVVFETDRWATWREPTNTELHLARARGDAPSPTGSRRITFHPGADDHPVMSASGGVLVWSRGEGGRTFVASATLRSGHGGLLLGRPAVLLAGRAQWAAPLGWSPDARSLVVVRGNPYRPLRALSLDLARGTREALGPSPTSGQAPVSFDADGGWVAITGTERDRAAGLLPSALGFLLGPFATRASRDRPLFRGTSVATGPSRGPLAAVELGAIGAWGEPTGVALEPDGTRFVLGQRRARGGAVEERLVEVALDCEPSPSSEAGGAGARDATAMARTTREARNAGAR